MPLKRNQKPQKKEDAERKKKILSTKERILAKKRFLLQIIETMIEDEVPKEWFLSKCTYLCQADFDDVIQERSIGTLCGYPLCSNTIEQTFKQKYHISRVTNKVYDVTERKCFCSNQCYKASNYIKAQLSPIPLYMRKEEKISVCLLSDCENRGSAGEEIIFHHKIPTEEVYRVYSDEASNNLQNLLHEEVKKCADSLSGLQIKEHVFEKQYIFSDETPNKSDALKDKNASHSESELDSDDSIDEKLFPNYDNEAALSNRHMPIPEKIKKSVLIPPKKSEVKPVSRSSDLSLHFVRKVFKDWITEDTLKYLMGEKFVYGVKAEHLFKTMTESDFSCSEKLASIKDEYIRLCLKIDSLPDDEDICDYPELDLTSESNTKPTPKKTEPENNSDKKVFKRRPRKSKDTNKFVTFALENKKDDLQPEIKDVSSSEKHKSDVSPEEKSTIEQKSKENVNKANAIIEQKSKENVKELDAGVEQKVKVTVKEANVADADILSKNAELVEEPPIEDLPEPQLAFPLVDSISQNLLRRQVLTKKLKSVYTELLPVAGLHYTDIRENVRKFIDSLSLTPTNIIYKPKEWKLISLVLFRMLTRTILKDLHDELQFTKLCEDPMMPITIDLREIENLVCELVSTENIISIH